MGGRRWSVNELEFLSDNAGLLNHEQLSKRLGRSVSAIKLKQTHCGIRFLDNFYSYSLLSRELGRSRRRIGIWYRRGWIKGEQAKWRLYGKEPMMFKEEDIVAFLKEHHGLFNPNRMPNKYFASIVRGCKANASSTGKP